MISYCMFGTNNLKAAIAFYDRILKQLGASRVYEAERSAGWGWGVGTPMFIVTIPFDGEPASFGNGTMVAFEAASPRQVDKLHALVLELGGTSEGDPGMRGEQLYVGYCRDPDGNKFNFIHHLQPVA